MVPQCVIAVTSSNAGPSPPDCVSWDRSTPKVRSIHSTPSTSWRMRSIDGFQGPCTAWCSMPVLRSISRIYAVVAAASRDEASMPNSGMISVAKSSSMGRASSRGIIPQWKSHTK